MASPAASASRSTLVQLRALLGKPLFQAALTSGVVLPAGDAFCQLVIQRRGVNGNPEYDWRQTLRFGIVGLTLHGPFFYSGFRMLDARFGTSTTLRAALTKAAAGQVTMFPTYILSFYGYMGLLEGKTFEQVKQKISDSFVPTAITGTCFWPLVNAFNFLYIPPSARILYINGAGLVWNSFLSWSNTNWGQREHMEQLLGNELPQGQLIVATSASLEEGPRTATFTSSEGIIIEGKSATNEARGAAIAVFPRTMPIVSIEKAV